MKPFPSLVLFAIDNTEHFRSLYYCSLAFSALLAAGWFATILRMRSSHEKLSPRKRCDPTEAEERVMTEIHRMVVEQRYYLTPGLTLETLSDKLGLTRVSLSNAINRNTGCHFRRWLNEVRIEEALVRLSDPGRTCNFSEIAYDVGFNDRTTFFRAFKQIVGTSPREFCRTVEKKCCE